MKVKAKLLISNNTEEKIKKWFFFFDDLETQIKKTTPTLRLLSKWLKVSLPL